MPSTLVFYDAYPQINSTMANPAPSNDIAALGVNTRFTAENAGQQPSYRRAAFQEALEIQQILINDIRNQGIERSDRAALVRAWVLVEDCKRVLRGIPTPGQLRPDLDPVQLARANKRARSRTSIDIPHELAAILPADASESPRHSTTQPGPISNEAAQQSEHDQRERDKISKEKGTP